MRIFVAGHKGMVGSTIVQKLAKNTTNQIITTDRGQTDLTNQQHVNDFFAEQAIDQVYIAAAKVGGIYANNTYPAEFIYQNLMIETNIIHAAHKNNIQKLLFLGSSCIYPKMADQPMKEQALLTGPLEATNESYAIAKIAGIKLCEGFNRQYGYDYRSIMPTNIYGINDYFHSENAHVIPALIRRFHEAKMSSAPMVTTWGTGSPKREFIYVDDVADAAIFIMNVANETYKQHTTDMLSHINVGTGRDSTLKELAQIIAKVIGFEGSIQWDTSKPDGTPRKLLDVSRIRQMGWSAKIDLHEGLEKTYTWFLANQASYRQ